MKKPSYYTKLVDSVAIELGVNSAYLIAKLDLLLIKSKTQTPDNQTWVLESLEDFSRLLPMVSPRTIRRELKKLESEQIILTRPGPNRSKFYSLNYEYLAKHGYKPKVLKHDKKTKSSPDLKGGVSNGVVNGAVDKPDSLRPKWPDVSGQNGQTRGQNGQTQTYIFNSLYKSLINDPDQQKKDLKDQAQEQPKKVDPFLNQIARHPWEINRRIGQFDPGFVDFIRTKYLPTVPSFESRSPTKGDAINWLSKTANASQLQADHIPSYAETRTMQAYAQWEIYQDGISSAAAASQSRNKSEPPNIERYGLENVPNVYLDVAFKTLSFGGGLGSYTLAFDSLRYQGIDLSEFDPEVYMQLIAEKGTSISVYCQALMHHRKQIARL